MTQGKLRSETVIVNLFLSHFFFLLNCEPQILTSFLSINQQVFKSKYCELFFHSCRGRNVEQEREYIFHSIWKHHETRQYKVNQSINQKISRQQDPQAQRPWVKKEFGMCQKQEETSLPGIWSTKISVLCNGIWDKGTGKVLGGVQWQVSVLVPSHLLF